MARRHSYNAMDLETATGHAMRWNRAWELHRTSLRQRDPVLLAVAWKNWIPACAGMTGVGIAQDFATPEHSRIPLRCIQATDAASGLWG